MSPTETAPVASEAPPRGIFPVEAPNPGVHPESPNVILNAFPAPSSRIIVSVQVTSGTVSAGDWIGLYPAGADTSKYVTYQRAPEKGGTINFRAPKDAGIYEFRCVLDDDRTVIATSPPVTIAEGVDPHPNVILESGAVAVRRGEDIPVTWTVTSGDQSHHDWIGLYERDAANRDFIGWSYVGDTDRLRDTLTLKAPEKPGTYEIRYLLDDGYESVGPTLTIVVY